MDKASEDQPEEYVFSDFITKQGENVPFRNKISKIYLQFI
jgi:hypothetical protein